MRWILIPFALSVTGNASKETTLAGTLYFASRPAQCDWTAPSSTSKPRSKGAGSHPNNVRRMRIERMMSKAELARRANLSVLTIDRVEKGFGCRMDTKRKLLDALGLSLGDRVRVFGEEE